MWLSPTPRWGFQKQLLLHTEQQVERKGHRLPFPLVPGPSSAGVGWGWGKRAFVGVGANLPLVRLRPLGLRGGLSQP